jgi:hypothetical protein
MNTTAALSGAAVFFGEERELTQRALRKSSPTQKELHGE